MLYSQYQKVQWNARMARDYGYRNTNLQQTTPADVRMGLVAGVGTQATFVEPGLEDGVKAINWNQDFAFQKPGSETRRTYLVTSPGSNCSSTVQGTPVTRARVTTARPPM